MTTIDSKALRLKAWEGRKHPGPCTLFLFPTYRCNLKCAICGRTYGENPRDLLDELPDERLLALVDEAADLGVKEWILAGGGEPMIRSELVVEMCTKIRDRDMNGTLQSNGTLFKKEHIESLVRVGWDRVSISIDGPTAASSDAARFKGAFDKACAAVRTLAETKEAHDSEHPYVAVAAVITAHNCDELVEMVRLVHSLGATSLSLSDLIVFDREGMADLCLSEEQQAALPDRFARAQEEADRLGLELVVPSPLTDVECPVAWPPEEPRATDYGGAPRVPLNAGCFQPWMSIVVLSHGIVSPCCIFWEQNADSIRDKSLRDVWFGPYMEDIRHKVLLGPLPSYCLRCPASMYSRHASLLMEKAQLPKKSDFRLSTPKLAKKMVFAFRRHGLSSSVKRGKEWLEIRKRLR